MITRIVRWAYLCAFLALLSLPASGQSAPSQSEWIKTLRDGGYVIIFRHGATYQDQADTDPLNPNNVLKQRQLNDEGRALAKSIGESLHKLRIPVGQVHTSLFQRAMDTGALMGFGDEDRFVVITDGEELMNLVLYWRDDVPPDWPGIPGAPSRRIAGQLPATIGDPARTAIQSEQSVVVAGYGALVVNNEPASIPDGGRSRLRARPLVSPSDSRTTPSSSGPRGGWIRSRIWRR